MKLKIRVANPVSGNLTYIPLESAKRYVARGCARWKNNRTIVFIEDHHIYRSAEDSVLIARTGYDRIGRMSFEQIKGLPVIGDPVKLFTVRR